MSLMIKAVQLGGTGVIYSDEHRHMFEIPDVFAAGNGKPISDEEVGRRIESRAWMDPREFCKKNAVSLDIWHSNVGPVKGAMMSMHAEMDKPKMNRTSSNTQGRGLATATA